MIRFHLTMREPYGNEQVKIQMHAYAYMIHTPAEGPSLKTLGMQGSGVQIEHSEPAPDLIEVTVIEQARGVIEKIVQGSVTQVLDNSILGRILSDQETERAHNKIVEAIATLRNCGYGGTTFHTTGCSVMIAR